MNDNCLNRKQYDRIIIENDQHKEDLEIKNKYITVNSINFGWFIGFGYWKDIYKVPFKGYTINILLPFVRIQTGVIKMSKNKIILSRNLLDVVSHEKIDLIKEYLEPTGLTITELMNRNIYASLCQLLDAYLLEAVRNSE